MEDPSHVAKLEGPFGVLAAGMISIPIDLPGTPFNLGIKASNFIMKELVAIIKQTKIDLAEEKMFPTKDILSLPSSVCASIVNTLLSCLRATKEFTKGKWKLQNQKVHVNYWIGLIFRRRSTCEVHVAREVTRLAAPVQGTFREAINDFMYNGFFIPKGWKLLWSVNSTHKNVEFFPEPRKFDPSRFEGCGPKICPGKDMSRKRYARMKRLVFMHHLVKRFRWEKMIPDGKIVVNPMPEYEKGLPIRLFPHKA
ncbi:cytochrome P450, family 716, subfamily A, polypeptide 1 [Actinidia rufa]|uniref:Cytochrome P450, family 716, subfamily A, polypeptide 1 n=1 Tax=Actinidia rufa TaxID=165716 RepID=A0A7J0D902_9ERIC|nr:cytochrome P450, family 716, subfamily A, polypeptide 1 [Actinidia rufa]